MANRFGRNQRRKLREQLAAAKSETVAAKSETVAAKSETVAAKNETLAAKNETLAAKNETLAERESLKHYMELYQELRGRMHRWAYDVRNLMGDNSAFNERCNTHRVQRINERYRLTPGIHSFPVGPLESIPDDIAERVIEAMVYTLTTQRDIYRDRVRVMLQCETTGDAAISIPSGTYLGERDIELMTRELVRLMNIKIRKRG